MDLLLLVARAVSEVSHSGQGGEADQIYKEALSEQVVQNRLLDKPAQLGLDDSHVLEQPQLYFKSVLHLYLWRHHPYILPAGGYSGFVQPVPKNPETEDQGEEIEINIFSPRHPQNVKHHPEFRG